MTVTPVEGVLIDGSGSDANRGMLRFTSASTASGASGGNCIFRATGDTLMFQSGTGGHLFVNSNSSVIALKMTDGGDVGVGAAVPLARLEVRAAAGNLETLALSGDSQSTITMRNKGGHKRGGGGYLIELRRRCQRIDGSGRVRWWVRGWRDRVSCRAAGRSEHPQ